jgi:hypothetical protein
MNWGGNFLSGSFNTCALILLLDLTKDVCFFSTLHALMS